MAELYKRKKKKQTFWKKIRFQYRLTFRNESTLEEVFSFRLSRLSGFYIIAVFAFVLILLTSIVIINTPIRNYLPGQINSEVWNKIISDAMRADSLEQVVGMHAVYLNNIEKILTGKMKADSIPSVADTLSFFDMAELETSSLVAEILAKYEEEERYNLTALASGNMVIPENTIFYKPVKGIITDHFNPVEKRFGIDIAANQKETVLATLKGTVTFAGFEANDGYVIQLQHKGGVASIYKHNAVLLKSIGDNVVAGEAIAIVGNTGRSLAETHLRFEIWANGVPIDPEEVIVF